MAIFHLILGQSVFIKAEDDGSGGDIWSYKTCKASVKSSSTNQHSVIYVQRKEYLVILVILRIHKKTEIFENSYIIEFFTKRSEKFTGFISFHVLTLKKITSKIWDGVVYKCLFCGSFDVESP